MNKCRGGQAFGLVFKAPVETVLTALLLESSLLIMHALGARVPDCHPHGSLGFEFLAATGLEI